MHPKQNQIERTCLTCNFVLVSLSMVYYSVGQVAGAAFIDFCLVIVLVAPVPIFCLRRYASWQREKLKATERGRRALEIVDGLTLTLSEKIKRGRGALASQDGSRPAGEAGNAAAKTAPKRGRAARPVVKEIQMESTGF